MRVVGWGRGWDRSRVLRSGAGVDVVLSGVAGWLVLGCCSRYSLPLNLKTSLPLKFNGTHLVAFVPKIFLIGHTWDPKGWFHSKELLNLM